MCFILELSMHLPAVGCWTPDMSFAAAAKLGTVADKYIDYGMDICSIVLYKMCKCHTDEFD